MKLTPIPNTDFQDLNRVFLPDRFNRRAWSRPKAPWLDMKKAHNTRTVLPGASASHLSPLRLYSPPRNYHCKWYVCQYSNSIDKSYLLLLCLFSTDNYYYLASAS